MELKLNSNYSPIGLTLVLLLTTVIFVPTTAVANYDWVPEHRQAYHTCKIHSAHVVTRQGHRNKAVILGFGCQNKKKNRILHSTIDFKPLSQNLESVVLPGANGGSLKSCTTDVFGGEGYPMYLSISCGTMTGPNPPKRVTTYDVRGENIDGGVRYSFLRYRYNMLL